MCYVEKKDDCLSKMYSIVVGVGACDDLLLDKRLCVLCVC